MLTIRFCLACTESTPFLPRGKMLPWFPNLEAHFKCEAYHFPLFILLVLNSEQMLEVDYLNLRREPAI